MQAVIENLNSNQMFLREAVSLQQAQMQRLDDCMNGMMTSIASFDHEMEKVRTSLSELGENSRFLADIMGGYLTQVGEIIVVGLPNAEPAPEAYDEICREAQV